MQSALEARNPLLVPILPFWYLIMHLSYGSGLLQGFNISAGGLKGREKKRSEDVEVIVRKALG
jgi:hypothetical protein